MARLATTGRGSRRPAPVRPSLACSGDSAAFPLRTVSIYPHCGASTLRVPPASAWSYSRFWFLLLASLMFLLGNGVLAWAQDSSTPDNPIHIQPRVEKPESDNGVDPALTTHTRPYKVDVNLVLIPVTITDPMNRLVTGLEKDNFEIYDDDKKQVIQDFSSEDSPISMGVIFDVSGSMSDKMEKAREAVVEFFRTANPDDEFFMISFSDQPHVLSDFTQSIEDIQGKLLYTIPKGRTSLLDAIYLGLDKMRHARHQKKALLIISDGGDNHSRYTLGEIKSIVREADVQVYAIGIFSQSPATVEERMGPQTLSDITDVTGGRTFTIENPNELADVATKIGIELRNQYVIGYRPTNPVHDGKWRKVKIKLNPPKGLPPLHVYAKSGYYAPSQ